MQLVVDTSVIIAVIANEPEKGALVAATAGAELVAPGSMPWEVGNAFSAMLKRERISESEAFAALEVYRHIPVRLVDVSLAESLALASDLGIYAYDAYFLEAARMLRCDLLTLDRGLKDAARRADITLREVPS
jgi:predicted nucleic acid-binding protein